jgi:hypothetical protein
MTQNTPLAPAHAINVPCGSYKSYRAFFGIPRTMPAVVLIILAVILTCSQAFATNTNYVHRPTGLVLPEKISFFQRGDVRDYDLNYPGLGTGIPYTLANMSALIDIYDLGRNGLEIKVDDIKREIKRAVDAVHDKVKDGYYGPVEILDPPSVFSSGGGKWPVYMAGFTVNVGSNTFREYIYMTSYKKHYVRVTFTHPESFSDDIVRNAFVHDILTLLQKRVVEEKRPEPKRSKPRIKRSKHQVPHLEDLELYRKK